MSSNSINNNNNQINYTNFSNNQDDNNSINDTEDTNNIDDNLSDDVIEALGINNQGNQNGSSENATNHYENWISEEEEAALQDLEELEKIDSLV